MNELCAVHAPPMRLVPEMASRRLAVLAFVRGYITRMHGSPSIMEIAHGVNTSRSGVRRALKRLVADGLLIRMPAPRGLALPEAEAAALGALLATGWAVDAAARRVMPPNARHGAKPALLLAIELDYTPSEPSARVPAGGLHSDEAGHEARGQESGGDTADPGGARRAGVSATSRCAVRSDASQTRRRRTGAGRGQPGSHPRMGA